MKNRHEVLVDEESIRELLGRRARMLSVSGAAYNLDLDEEELLDLIRHGCLKAASGPGLDGFPDVRLETGSVSGLYRRVEQRAEPSRENVITVEIFGDGVGLEEVREQLKARKLSFGQWQRAVLDGAVTPLRLNPLGREFSDYTLREFAFRREDFEAYVNQRCPAVQIPPYLPAPKKRELTVSEMTDLLMGKWDRQQQTFTRKGVESYESDAAESCDVTLLGMLAKGIFERSDAAIPGRPGKLHRHYTSA
jgi:hypothetical protein